MVLVAAVPVVARRAVTVPKKGGDGAKKGGDSKKTAAAKSSDGGQQKVAGSGSGVIRPNFGKGSSGTQPIRLYIKGAFIGYRRSVARQQENQALIKLNGVHTRDATTFYLGKRVAYIYKATKEKSGTRFRVIWGRIQRAHGTNGVVRVSFRKNLPARAMGATVRVMLYPSNI